MTLTAAGRMLHPVIRDGLDAFANALSALKEPNDLQLLKVTTTNAFASKWLIPRLSLWRDAHPGITLEVIGTDAVLDLRADEIDLAIRYMNAAPKGFIAHELFRDTFVAVCSPRILSDGQPLQCLSGLTNHTLVHSYWSPIDANAPTWERWLQAASSAYPDVPQLNEMKYLNFREMDKRIVSKSIMKYHAPQDVRHLGYLVINKVDGSEDQFVYRPSSLRVRRINLCGEAIFGTDFAFEDIIPQELENATYVRKPDSELNDIPVYVVEVTPVEEQDSEYSKFDVYVTRDTYVALQVQYWDQDGLHIKELTSDPESITLFEEKSKDDPKKIWIAKSQKIRHLKLETWTQLTVENLESSSKLKKKHFSERELARGH